MLIILASAAILGASRDVGLTGLKFLSHMGNGTYVVRSRVRTEKHSGELLSFWGAYNGQVKEVPDAAGRVRVRGAIFRGDNGVEFAFQQRLSKGSPRAEQRCLLEDDHYHLLSKLTSGKWSGSRHEKPPGKVYLSPFELMLEFNGLPDSGRYYVLSGVAKALVLQWNLRTVPWSQRPSTAMHPINHPALPSDTPVLIVERKALTGAKWTIYRNAWSASRLDNWFVEGGRLTCGMVGMYEFGQTANESEMVPFADGELERATKVAEDFMPVVLAALDDELKAQKLRKRVPTGSLK
jgi:hypothetical protein